MERFSNKDISRMLRNVSAAYLLQDEKNQFKIIAYEKAADTVESLSREIYDIWQEGKLDTIPTIGKSIQEHLDELFRTGQSRHFNSILKKIPSTVFLLMDIPGLGPKKAYKLAEKLHLKNDKTLISDLKKAVETGKIAKIPTFGEKSQEEIGQSIGIFEKRKSQTGRMALPYATTIADEVIAYLKKSDKVGRIDAMGSLRREESTVGDIDIAISAADKDAKEIIEYFTKFPRKVKIDNAGGKKASIIIHPNIRVDLRIEPEKSYGAMLQYFTGNKSHNIKLREFALKKGLSLSEYGIKNTKTGKIMEFKDEESFYKYLGLQYIPPELREGTNEIDIAKVGKIPKLVELPDIKGDLHLHSSFDLMPSHDLGSSDFETILKKGKELHYEYVGFSEHNPKSGLTETEIEKIMKRRKNELDRVSESNIHFFSGLEVDIMPNGKIGLPESAIKYLDYLIVSVHSVFKMGAEVMTKRVLSALDAPKVKILGHPTGRMLGTREGFELQWEKIFEACKKRDIALEINCWPERLDLPDTLVHEAIDADVKLVIDTDAHAASQMDLMRYGVSVARRGWAAKGDIMNALPYTEFKKWIKGGE